MMKIKQKLNALLTILIIQEGNYTCKMKDLEKITATNNKLFLNSI